MHAFNALRQAGLFFQSIYSVLVQYSSWPMGMIGRQGRPGGSSSCGSWPLSGLVAKEERWLCYASLTRPIKEHGLHGKP